MNEEKEKDLQVPTKEYYDEKSFVNLRWVGSVATLLLVVGALAIVGGAIFMVHSLDAYSEGYGVMGATMLASGFIALFMGALLKVVMQIEANTRL